LSNPSAARLTDPKALVQFPVTIGVDAITSLVLELAGTESVVFTVLPSMHTPALVDTASGLPPPTLSDKDIGAQFCVYDGVTRGHIRQRSIAADTAPFDTARVTHTNTAAGVDECTVRRRIFAGVQSHQGAQ